MEEPEVRPRTIRRPALGPQAPLTPTATTRTLESEICSLKHTIANQRTSIFSTVLFANLVFTVILVLVTYKWLSYSMPWSMYNRRNQAANEQDYNMLLLADMIKLPALSSTIWVYFSWLTATVCGVIGATWTYWWIRMALAIVVCVIVTAKLG